MRVQRWIICIILAGVLCRSDALADAASQPPNEVIKNRIANFRKIGEAFKGIRDELKAYDPSLPSIRESAGQIESLGSQILSWFPPRTGLPDAHAGGEASSPKNPANAAGRSLSDLRRTNGDTAQPAKVTPFAGGNGADARKSAAHDFFQSNRTRAKAQVWTERASFEQAQKRLYAEALKMNDVARSGDTSAIAAELRVLGEACKGCHSKFRERE